MPYQSLEPIQPPSTSLSLESQFTVVYLMTLVETASLPQLKTIYKELLTAHLGQKQYYDELIKHQWGIDGGINKRHDKEEL